MNREIKFRAWDKDDLVMLYSDAGDGEAIWTVGFDGVYVATEIIIDREVGGEHEQSYDWRPPKQVLMQYTGLKDKNGKEIYEGDIVRIHLAMLGVVEWREDTASFVTRFLEADALKEKSDHLMGINTCEVIGNIYENPELLGQVTGLATPDQEPPQA